MCEKIVSVIIPTCCRSRFLNKAIESVINQSFKDFEIIVVNDSDDESGVTSALKGCNDKRLKVFNNIRTKGANGARNTGLERSSGRYIAVLDDDDIFLPEKLEKQVSILNSNPEIGVVSTQAYVIDENDNVVRSIDYDRTSGQIHFKLVFSNCIVHSSVLIRRDLFNQVGFYNEKLNQVQDYDLWSRMLNQTKFFQINEKLVCWREHANSISGSRKHEQKLSALNIAAENIRLTSGVHVSIQKLEKILTRNEKTLLELRYSVWLFRKVYKNLVVGVNIYPNGSSLYKKETSIEFRKEIECRLYSYFSSHSILFLMLGFFVLPMSAKCILFEKAINRIRRDTINRESKA